MDNEWKELLDSSDLPQEIKDNVVYVVRSGSHAYGLNTESSDKDYKAVVIPPKEYYLGLKKFTEVSISTSGDGKNTKNDIDLSVISINKFIEELIKGSPTYLEMLFVDDEDILYRRGSIRYLITSRLFTSKALYPRFRGFAKSEMKSLYKIDDGSSYDYNHKKITNAIRLLFYLEEILKTGAFDTKIKSEVDMNLLLDFKSGDFPVNVAISFYEDMDYKVGLLLEVSTLPDKIDKNIMNLIESTLISIIQHHWYDTGQ